MPLSAKVGSFALNTSTGNQSVSGLGFQPKVVIFFYNSATSDSTNANARIGFGVGISSSDRRAIYNVSIDNQASSTNTAANQNTSCIYLGGNPIADLVSLDSDGFTVNLS